MRIRIGILFVSVLLCLGCDKPAPPDPRIAELEAEIKKLKSGVKTLDAAKDKSLDGSKRAIRELKRVNSVIEMGVNYPDYTKTLLEAKPTFDEAVEDLSDGELRTAFTTTMEAYIDANKFWNLCNDKKIAAGDKEFFSPEQMQPFKKYNLKWVSSTSEYSNWERSQGFLLGDRSMLQDIWLSAKVSLARSDELLKQQTAK